MSKQRMKCVGGDLTLRISRERERAVTQNRSGNTDYTENMTLVVNKYESRKHLGSY